MIQINHPMNSMAGLRWRSVSASRPSHMLIGARHIGLVTEMNARLVSSCDGVAQLVERKTVGQCSHGFGGRNAAYEVRAGSSPVTISKYPASPSAGLFGLGHASSQTRKET